MYFFYDTTSLGRQEVIDTHNIVNNWITGLRDIGAFNGKVYHTSVLGERWLDWAIMPYTGVFNNAGYCGGVQSPGLGTPGVIGPQNPNWPGGTGGREWRRDARRQGPIPGLCPGGRVLK